MEVATAIRRKKGTGNVSPSVLRTWRRLLACDYSKRSKKRERITAQMYELHFLWPVFSVQRQIGLRTDFFGESLLTIMEKFGGELSGWEEPPARSLRHGWKPKLLGICRVWTVSTAPVAVLGCA